MRGMYGARRPEGRRSWSRRRAIAAGRPPVVAISPDGQMAWMAVEVEAQYTQTAKPAEGEKTFKSSWIATYQRDKCAWRMTGMASNVVG